MKFSTAGHRAPMLLLLMCGAVFAQSNALRNQELNFLRQAVAPDLLDVAHLQLPALENVAIGSDASGPFLRLRTRHGQPLLHGGVRAELTIDNPHAEGDTLRYSWRFKIADDFVSDAPANRWWLFGDWHDQPDPRLNQTWDGFPPRSPPIALGYGQIGGQDNLSLVYGAPNPITIGLIPFKRGVWNKVTVQIKWSRGASGSVAVYLNDSSTPVQQATGPNMHNSYQHFLKLGSYRHPDIRGDVWVNITDVSIVKVAG
jgi:hypothetical protein